MQPRLAGVLAAAVLGACAGAASAGPDGPAQATGFYLEAYGGANWIDDNALQTSLAPGAPVDQTFFLDYDKDSVAGLRLGYRASAHLRGDLEIAWRRNAIGGLSSPPNIITPGYSFTFRSRALMANGYYDFAPIQGVTPYLGAGLGVASVATAGSIAPGDPGFDYSARQSALAAQLRLGATYALSETMDIGVEYTHFRAFGIDDNLSASYFDTLRDDYVSNSVSVLLRMRF